MTWNLLVAQEQRHIITRIGPGLSDRRSQTEAEVHRSPRSVAVLWFLPNDLVSIRFYILHGRCAKQFRMQRFQKKPLSRGNLWCKFCQFIFCTGLSHLAVTSAHALVFVCHRHALRHASRQNEQMTSMSPVVCDDTDLVSRQAEPVTCVDLTSEITRPLISFNDFKSA